MKKNIWIIGILAMVICSCTSISVNYRQDGLIPFEYFLKAKMSDERLVLLSPVLAPDHRQSTLYIITNPEDIPKAIEVLGDPGYLKPKELEKKISAFSPVIITSSRDITKVNYTSSYNISNQDGIAVFSIPQFIDRLFYAYITMSKEKKMGSNDSAKVYIGIMSMPPNIDDVYISFSEMESKLVVSANMNPEFLKLIYASTTGFYGQIQGSKYQTGFMKIGLKERFAVAHEQGNAKALAAGATINVYSAYYTKGKAVQYRIENRRIGSQSATYGGGSVGDPGYYGDIVPYIGNVPIRNELEFELFRGDIIVYRGITPAEITGIEVGTEYTLRWISPGQGPKYYKFTMGLNFFGYPGNGRFNIE